MHRITAELVVTHCSGVCRYMCDVWYKNSGDKELQTVVCIAVTLAADGSIVFVCLNFIINVWQTSENCLYHIL